MSSLERVPPGQGVTVEFPVLHIGPIPPFDPHTWDFQVWGRVKKPGRWSWAQFCQLPRLSLTADFHCVTGWSRLDCHWEGVAFRTLASLVQPEPQARFCLILAEAGYTTNLPLWELMEADVLLAMKLDGQDLEPAHGAPLRLVVPKRYAYKSAKWVRGIEFTTEEVLGYWEQRGYSNSADPWKEERLEAQPPE